MKDENNGDKNIEKKSEGKLEAQIRQKIMTTFAPTNLELENESHQHSVPKGSETHFRVLIVSALFRGLSRVARSRLVYDCLALEMKSGVHALAQRTFDPEEWEARGETVDSTSPPCFGGSKKDNKPE